MPQAPGYLKALAVRHGLTHNTAHANDQLPLGARIGGGVTMQMTPYIRAQAAGSFVQAPDAALLTIQAIGHLHGLLDSGDLYRLYTEVGDDDSDGRAYLQIETDADGDLLEITSWTRIARIIIPVSEEDQATFFDGKPGGIGEQVFTLYRDDLIAMGYTDTELVPIFGEVDHIDYARAIGDAQTPFVPPLSGQEIRIDDANGTRGLQQDVTVMIYLRALQDGSNEMLMISAELVQSHNGDSTKRDVHVDFMAGIMLDPVRVQIQ